MIINLIITLILIIIVLASLYYLKKYHLSYDKKFGKNSSKFVEGEISIVTMLLVTLFLIQIIVIII